MKTIILGTAHLKSTPGKCSPDGKFKEYKYSREIVAAVKAILQNLGYNVFVDIEDDDLKVTQSQELCLRCKVVNDLCKAYKDCIYISIHVNAAASDGKWHTGTGWEVYTSPGKTSADDLATCLYEAAKKNFTNIKLIMLRSTVQICLLLHPFYYRGIEMQKGEPHVRAVRL